MRIAINGFGRIGRQVFRMAVEDPNLEVVHINDVTKAPVLAHLVQFDSTYGRWNREVRGEDDVLYVEGRPISVSAETDPTRLPWRDKGVEVVLESTGKFTRREDASKHLEAGARAVLVSAPGKTPLDGDFVIGVNEERYDPDRHRVISIGSCTTNALAPLAKVLDAELGIEQGFMNTVHAYTNDQRLLDGPHKDLRRARAAAQNIIPTSTGAARAISAILPELTGKLDGLSLRVPVQCGSILDLTCVVRERTSAEAVNDVMRRWAGERMQGILQVMDAPIVSSDVIGSEYSSILSAPETAVQGEHLVKVLSWYDNEWAFSRRCVDMIARM